jgi:FemAB-related protein (PEP-CTERM system-associated)
LFLVKTWWKSAYFISIPWLDYGGIAADSLEIEEKILEHARQLTQREKTEFMELRSVHAGLDQTVHRTDKVTFLLDLSPGEELLWKKFGAKLRNQIRKAEKSGLTTLFGRHELLDEFYTVFSRNMRDLGTPVWGRDLFEAVLSTFKEKSSLILVQKDGVTIAAGLVLSFGGKLYVPSASSYRSARIYCPNHALYWEVIKRGCREGHRYFDFGRSTKDAPTYRFKKQWVPDPTQLVWQYHLNLADRAPTASDRSAKYRLMINLWRRLPVWVANLLGPRVIRNFP